MLANAADQAIRFQALLLDTAGQAIFAVDEHEKILFWNRQAGVLFGWPASHAIGRSMTDLNLATMVVGAGVSSQGAVDEGETWSFERVVSRLDGTTVPVLATSTRIVADDGVLVAVITVANDITERRQVDERTRRLSAIVESSSDAIVGMDLDRIITSWNPGAEAIFGYDATEAVGQSVTMLAPSFAQDPELTDLATRNGLSISSLETSCRTKSGSTVHLSLSLSPIFDEDGNAIGVSGIGRDISDRIELARLAEVRTLELAEAEHAAAVEIARREEADRANRAKSEFLSRMSHELRTPLNAVLGFSQILDMSDLDDSQRRNLTHIRTAGEHLLALINEVLDITRIEAGAVRLSLEPVRLEEVLTGALDLIRPQAARHGITVPEQVDGGDVSVIADRQRLMQVMLNLLSNAVKYNRPGGRVDIAWESSGGTTSVAVIDTGVGIAEADVGRLFIPFERLGAEGSDIEGTGVGLPLSRLMTEQMGGALVVHSTVGVGSTFTVEFPSGTPATAADADRAADLSEPVDDGVSDDETKPVTVLAIEDNVANIGLLETVTRFCGNATLVSAIQGRLGLQLAAQEHPDLILLDLDLPDMAGEAVLGFLRTDPVTAQIPVVVCSADTSPGQSEKLLALGAAAYLTKPIDLTIVLELIQAARPG